MISSSTETQEEHDRNLEKFLQCCRKVGIRLNKMKFQTGLNSVDFIGHRVTPTGMKPDPEKVRAILDMEAPKDVSSVRRFIGTVNYLARFLPHLSQTLQPLQNLLQKDVPFNWSGAQEEAFDHIKQKIASSPVLAFFQPDAPITLQNNASEYRLGAVLMQKDKPVAYASRSLKPAERNNAQIEKEMLAIVFGLEKFHHYTYGVPGVTVVTDHKPLVAITNKPLSKAPRRLKAMLLRLQPYSIKVEYQPGSTLAIADTLSRAPLPDSSRTTETVTVNNLQWMPVKRHKLDEIRGATETRWCTAEAVQSYHQRMAQRARRRGGRSEALLLVPRRADYARRHYLARRQDCHPNIYAEGSETEGTCRTHGNQHMHSKSSRPRFLARNVKRNPTTGGKLQDLRASRQLTAISPLYKLIWPLHVRIRGN